MDILRRSLEYALSGSFKRKVLQVNAQQSPVFLILIQATFVAGASFLVGFSMETFMVHTGFYKIVTKKVCLASVLGVRCSLMLLRPTLFELCMTQFVSQEAERREEAIVSSPALSSPPTTISFFPIASCDTFLNNISLSVCSFTAATGSSCLPSRTLTPLEPCATKKTLNPNSNTSSSSQNFPLFLPAVPPRFIHSHLRSSRRTWRTTRL
jgi:hypothetical protein